MEFTDLMPIIILFVFLLIGVAVVVGLIAMIKRGSPKHETNLDLERKVEILEREVEDIKRKI